MEQFYNYLPKSFKADSIHRGPFLTNTFLRMYISRTKFKTPNSRTNLFLYSKETKENSPMKKKPQETLTTHTTDSSISMTKTELWYAYKQTTQTKPI